MNNLLKDLGLILIALIGVLLIITRLTTVSPSNTFLAITAITCSVGLVGYLVMNHFMGDD